MVGTAGVGVGEPVDPDPTDPADPAVLDIDFNTVASTTSYGDSATMLAVWNQLAPTYVASSAGLTEQRITTKDSLKVLECRMVPTPSGPNGTIVQEVRLGQTATRLDLGQEGWLAYEVMFNVDWPFVDGKSGKLPGLSGGDTFPADGSTLTAQWKGWAARLLHDADSLGVNPESYAYIYYYDRSIDSTTGALRLAGEQWPCKADGYSPTTGGFNTSDTEKFHFERDTWYQVVERVVMNSDADTKDAIHDIYIDGVLRMRRTGFRWVGPEHDATVRTAAFDAAKGVDGFFFSHSFGGDSSTAPATTCYSWFKYFRFGRTAAEVEMVTPDTSEPETPPTGTDGNLARNRLIPSMVPADAILRADATMDSSISPMRIEESYGPGSVSHTDGYARIHFRPGANGYGGIPGMRVELKLYTPSYPDVDFSDGRRWFFSWDTYFESGFFSKFISGTDHGLLMQTHGQNVDGRWQGGVTALRARGANFEFMHQSYQTDPTSSIRIGSTPWAEGQWDRWVHEMVFRKSGGVIRLWRNGTLVGQKSGYTYNEGWKKYIGPKVGPYNTISEDMYCRIDNVRVWLAP